jgi:Xaa-Pro dipeptidase
LYRDHLSILQRRLEVALEAESLDGLIVRAGLAPAPPRDDVPYAYRPEPFFSLWCPYAAVAGAALLLRGGRKPLLIHPADDDYWHLPATAPSGDWLDGFDLALASSARDQNRILDRECRGADGPGRIVELDSDAAADLLLRLGYDRAYKTDFELDCIARANAIAVRGHRAVARAFGAEASEFDLHLAYLAAARQREDQLPYPNIVALNEHAAVLHYQRLDTQPPAEIRSLLIDAGARWLGYAADITRSYAQAKASDFAALIKGMEQLQQTLAGEARAGIEFQALHERAHELLAELLASHGLVRCSAAQALELGLTRRFLPHGLGHLLGLQVHDFGGRQQDTSGAQREPPAGDSYLRLTRRLEPGFVVTIEPGLYFIDALLADAPRGTLNSGLIDELRRYGGIRIEDDVAVKAGDNINLTRRAFASAAA